MVVTLNITWNTETRICSDIGSSPGKRDTSIFTAGSLKIQISAVKIAVPITLKVKCIRATRLELEFAPTDARSAVIQVPMLAPRTMNKASSRGITPVPTKEIKGFVIYDEIGELQCDAKLIDSHTIELTTDKIIENSIVGIGYGLEHNGSSGKANIANSIGYPLPAFKIEK